MLATALAVLLLLGLVLVPACSLADRAFYYPTGHVYTTPAEDGLAFEAVRFQSADGTTLSGWFIPATGEAVGTVVHFHGNAQNMTAHYGFVNWLPPAGFNLFVFDYRGYGASEGKPGRQGVYEDSVAALEYVLGRPDVQPGHVIALGQSLGGANAILAVGRGGFDAIAGVAVEAPFASHEQVACDHVVWPLRPLVALLVRDRLSPVEAVGEISPVPLLIMHGKDDRVVPYHHGERLLEAAGEPRDMWTFDGGHLAALTTDREQMAPRLLRRMRRWVGADE